jgi:hypothetical protein
MKGNETEIGSKAIANESAESNRIPECIRKAKMPTPSSSCLE